MNYSIFIILLDETSNLQDITKHRKNKIQLLRMSHYNDNNSIASDQAQLQSDRRRIDEVLAEIAEPDTILLFENSILSNWPADILLESRKNNKERLSKEATQLLQNEAIICLKDRLGRLPLDTYFSNFNASTSNMDFNMVSKLIPLKENANVLIAYFLKMMEYRHSAASKNSDEFKDVMCAFSWPLPLHPWTEVDVRRNTVTVAREAYLINRRISFLMVAKFNWCCSHIKRIRDDNEDNNEVNYLRRQQDRAFGKMKDFVPRMDSMKKKIFNSWSYPVNLASVCYMREMGEIYINSNLLDNVMRCQIAANVFSS